MRIGRLVAAVVVAIACLLVLSNSARAEIIDKSGTLAGNETWTSGNVYMINGDLTVPDGVTLAIDAGTVVKFLYTGDPKATGLLLVSGILDVGGTAADPVVFTSSLDDEFGGDSNGDGSASSPGPGNWGYIKYTNSDNVLEHAIVRYGGVRLVCPLSRCDTWNTWMVWADGGRLDVRNSVLEHAYSTTLYLQNVTEPTEVANNRFNHSGTGVRIVQPGPITVLNNSFTGNTSYGLYSDTDIVAENNWWGDVTGPYHPDSNPTGQGDSVSDHVDYDPWLTSAPVALPLLTVSPSSIPADSASTATVTLSNAPAGHRVRLTSSRGSLDSFSPSTGTTNVDGRFSATVHSSTPGTAVVTAEDLSTGFSFVTSVPVTFSPLDGQPTTPPISGEFDIVVDTTYALDGRFLEGWSVPNRILIDVPWPDDPGDVIIRVNGSQLVRLAAPNVDGRYQYILDMGTKLQAGSNTLEIIAMPPGDSDSVVKVYTPWSWPTPCMVQRTSGPGVSHSACTGRFA